MKIPKLNIGGLISELPILQGAMGVGVSGSGLAAAIMNQGGIGVLAGVDIGFREPDFFKNTMAANVRALKAEIIRVRELAPKGILGLNLMVAMNHYQEMVKAAVESGIDLIISGAGLPLDLPAFVAGSKTKIAPIVSSGKAAKTITKYWESHHGRRPDMIIVEGPEAGGHLGFSYETLCSPNRPSVQDLVKEVLEAIKGFQKSDEKPIPVIAAGGIFDGADIAHSLCEGADGVQMATRFVATVECDADEQYKMAYVDAKKEDVAIIVSPVGMPGRALINPFIAGLEIAGKGIKGCFNCLKACNPGTAPYCISDVLIKAVKGDVQEGLVFVGSNVHRIHEIQTVKEIIDSLKSELALQPECDR
ncbi:MAG: nitronate monooxygenase [Firmicutes bacterium HGW-Firmicutes-11]|nr:MAG: nitronate monooxygenase [Firmicutes bacterium HGW-Firmicutes-11]